MGYLNLSHNTISVEGICIHNYIIKLFVIINLYLRS